MSSALLLTACVACWVMDIIAAPAEVSVTLLLTVVNAVVLMRLCYKTNMTRTLSLMPVLMYMLPVSVIPWLHHCWQGQLTCTALLVCDMQLIGTYRADNASEQSFLGALLLCLGSLLCPEMILLVPLLWIFFLVQQSLNIKVFLSSLIAVGVVAVYVGLAVWFWPELQNSIIVNPFGGRHLLSFTAENTALAVAMSAALVFMVCAWARFSRESISVQTYITFGTIPLIVFVVLLVWQLDIMMIACMLLATLAMFSTHFFLVPQSLVRGVVFLAYLLVCYGYGIFSIYQSISSI